MRKNLRYVSKRPSPICFMRSAWVRQHAVSGVYYHASFVSELLRRGFVVDAVKAEVGDEKYWTTPWRHLKWDTRKTSLDIQRSQTPLNFWGIHEFNNTLYRASTCCSRASNSTYHSYTQYKREYVMASTGRRHACIQNGTREKLHWISKGAKPLFGCQKRMSLTKRCIERRHIVRGQWKET